MKTLPTHGCYASCTAVIHVPSQIRVMADSADVPDDFLVFM